MTIDFTLMSSSTCGRRFFTGVATHCAQTPEATQFYEAAIRPIAATERHGGSGGPVLVPRNPTAGSLPGADGKIASQPMQRALHGEVVRDVIA